MEECDALPRGPAQVLPMPGPIGASILGLQPRQCDMSWSPGSTRPVSQGQGSGRAGDSSMEVNDSCWGRFVGDGLPPSDAVPTPCPSRGFLGWGAPSCWLLAAGMLGSVCLERADQPGACSTRLPIVLAPEGGAVATGSPRRVLGAPAVSEGLSPAHCPLQKYISCPVGNGSKKSSFLTGRESSARDVNCSHDLAGPKLLYEVHRLSRQSPCVLRP